MFLHQGSDFTGSSAIGDFDSEHISSFSQHRLIPTHKFGWKITEEPVHLRRSLNQINSVLPMQKDQIGIRNSRAVNGRDRGVDLRASIQNSDQQAVELAQCLPFVLQWLETHLSRLSPKVGKSLARNRGHFFGSGMTMLFASRGCRTHATNRVFTLLGFLPTRGRHPVGSQNVSPALNTLAGWSSMAHSYSPSRTYPNAGPG